MLTEENVTDFKKAGKVFRALNHKLRQQMLAILYEQETTVTALYLQLRLEQSVASQHLAILRKEGIVKTRRNGKEVYYSVNESKIQDIKQAVGKIIL